MRIKDHVYVNYHFIKVYNRLDTKKKNFPTTAIKFRRPSTVNLVGTSFNGYDKIIFVLFPIKSIVWESIDDFKLIIIKFDWWLLLNVVSVFKSTVLQHTTANLSSS